MTGVILDRLDHFVLTVRDIEATCRFYETTLGTAPVAGFLPSLFVDISGVQERKREALQHLASQPDLGDRYETLAAYRALEAQSTAWMKGCRYAEAFVRLGTEAAGFSGSGGFGP